MTNFALHDKLHFYDNYEALREFRTHLLGGEILAGIQEKLALYLFLKCRTDGQGVYITDQISVRFYIFFVCPIDDFLYFDFHLLTTSVNAKYYY